VHPFVSPVRRSYVRAIVLGVLVACACGGAPAEARVNLTIVAYSTPQEPFEKVFTAFQKTPEGRNVTFSESYGASGDQSRAVVAGLPADLVAFALEPDMTRLVVDGLVARNWDAGRYRGFMTDSVVVLAVRRGNPRRIRTWDDLLRPGVEVITPNPLTSGGARWNVLAAYAAESAGGKDRAAGLAYLDQLFRHVAVQDTSVRNSLQTFANGRGDVLISYESEAIFARHHRQPLDYVVPDGNILIENPVAVTTRTKHPEQANAFLDFLRTPVAQRIFADAGYRPVAGGAVTSPAHLYTIDDVGGWPSADRRFFDPRTGALVDIEKKLGMATKS